MAAEVSTKIPYQQLVTNALEISMQLENALVINYKKMNACKGAAIWYLESALYLTQEEKRNAIQKSLTDYDTFMKAQQYVEGRFKALETSVQNCKQEPANDSPEYQALQTISSHLDNLITRTQYATIPLFHRRVGELASTLDLLISKLRPDLAGMRLLGYRTPALNAACDIWVNNPNSLFAGSEPIEETQPTALNQAINTLELSEWSSEKEKGLATLFDDDTEKADTPVAPESESSSLSKDFVFIPGESEETKSAPTTPEIEALHSALRSKVNENAEKKKEKINADPLNVREEAAFDKLERTLEESANSGQLSTNKTTPPLSWLQVVNKSKNEKNYYQSA